MHDSYFRAVLGAPARAADFLRCHLPAGIVDLLADEPPKLLDGTSLDEHLGNRQSDRLFRIWLKSGKSVPIIVEHASSVDPNMAYRVMRYRVRIWDGQMEALNAKDGLLTPIPVLVVYHGKAHWSAPCSLHGMVSREPEFRDMITGEPELRDEMCTVGYRLLDIGRMPEDRLARDPDTKGGLLTLGHGNRSPVGSGVLFRIRELIPEATISEEQTYQYMIDAFDADLNTLLATLETKGAATVGKLAEALISRGKAMGRAEGEAMGRASILNRLLEHRFGRLPATVRERVRRASVQDLDAWGDAVLDAPTLDAVFEDSPRH